jgi:hypothetical protein
LGLSVGYNPNLLALFIYQADVIRRNLVVSQRLFAVAFALDTASLPSKFHCWRQVSGLLKTIWRFLQHKQEREFTVRTGDSQAKRQPRNVPSQAVFSIF